MEHPAYLLLQRTLENLPRDLAYIGMALLLLVVARFIKDLMTPYRMREEMTARDNPALGMSVAGYYLAVLAICMGPLMTPAADIEAPLWKDLVATAGYTALGIVLLNAARIIVDKVLLPDFSTVKEIVEDRNAGMGAVEMGAYIASGLVIAGALHGQGGGPDTALAIFFVGQVLLVVYGRLYRVVCRYDIHQQIESDNVAAGVAFGLNLVAMGVILMKAVGGEFKGWDTHLPQIGIYAGLGMAFLLLARVLVDYLLLPGRAHPRRDRGRPQHERGVGRGRGPHRHGRAAESPSSERWHFRHWR